MSISGQTLSRLREVLLRCGPFRSYSSLSALFIDSRIEPWGAGLPDGGSPAGRVDALINYLSPQSNRQGDNALALFIEVLADRTSPSVFCYQELRVTANELANKSDAPIGRSQLYGWQQRANDLQTNISNELKLKSEYEQLMADERDPRTRRRYEGELTRSDKLIAQYQSELATLFAELEAVGQTTSAEVNNALQALQDEVKALRGELGEMGGRLAAGQATIKTKIDSNQLEILQRLDAQHKTIIEQFLKPLSKQQLELVNMVMDAHDRQELAKWEAEHLTNLVQAAVVDIKRVRQNTPSHEQWERVEALLGNQVAWQQKVKGSIPLIPFLLSLESEVSVDVWQALQQAWERMMAKVRKQDGAD